MVNKKDHLVKNKQCTQKEVLVGKHDTYEEKKAVNC